MTTLGEGEGGREREWNVGQTGSSGRERGRDEGKEVEGTPGKEGKEGKQFIKLDDSMISTT